MDLLNELQAKIKQLELSVKELRTSCFIFACNSFSKSIAIPLAFHKHKYQIV